MQWMAIIALTIETVIIPIHGEGQKQACAQLRTYHPRSVLADETKWQQMFRRNKINELKKQKQQNEAQTH